MPTITEKKFVGQEAAEQLVANVKAEINEALLNSKSDWNQTDETAADFIKNKPDEEDALALLMEMNLVEPVVAEDGSVYTDENGAMYTII